MMPLGRYEAQLLGIGIHFNRTFAFISESWAAWMVRLIVTSSPRPRPLMLDA